MRAWEVATGKELASFHGHVRKVMSVAVAPDGKRVAALMPVDTPEARRSQNHVILLMNFFDELRRRVRSNSFEQPAVPL